MDIEKLKKAFECCLNAAAYCEDCPYYRDSFIDCQRKLRDGAMELLKKQEPVEPRIQTCGSGVTWWNVCGNCQMAINPNDKYCHECGQAVKWDE